jgi:type II secretory pathway pseudopilin PulG
VDWIKCITSRLLRVVRREAGITLIETVMAIVIFGIVSTSLIAVLSSATAADGLSRQRSIALELAQQEVEYVRQLDYSSVGTQGGNPSGVVVATQTKLVAGLWYTLKTRIRWVSDPVPGGFTTSANYKQIRVTVTRNTDNKQFARIYTYLSSSTRIPYGGVNNAIINVTTQDYALKTALQNVAVDLHDGPANVSDVTDETGLVTFPALTPNPTSGNTSYYDIGTSLLNYQTLREDIGPTAPSPSLAASAAHVQVAPSQTVSTTIYLYQPVTFCIQIINASGTQYTGAASVDVGENLSSSSSLLRSADEFSQSGAASGSCYISVTGTGELSDDLPPAEGLIPSVVYQLGVRASTTTGGCASATSPSCYFAAATAQLSASDGYPNTLTKTIVVTLPASPNVATTKACTVTVKNSGGTKLANARVDVDDWSTTVAVPNIYFTGMTNSGGTYTFYVPAQAHYDVYARSGALRGSLANQDWTTNSCSALSVTVS